MKPCLGCGTPTAASRCPDCRQGDTGRKGRSHVHSNTAHWTARSKKLRRSSPFCEWCGATESLAVDHVIPVSVAADLAYAVENCRVLCRRCNGTRGNTYTTAEAQHVLAALQAAHTRRPTRAGRHRVEAAQLAVDALAGSPSDLGLPSLVKAQGALHTLGGIR